MEGDKESCVIRCQEGEYRLKIKAEGKGCVMAREREATYAYFPGEMGKATLGPTAF